MQFDFIGMQKLYLSLARQDAAPAGRGAAAAAAAARRTASGPRFVRNHDELTLDKLTEDERQEVFAAFGPEPEMQVYGRGLIRRLPPMLDGDPRRIRMVYSLLFSLPGTPVLFYGEEIGMGENLAAEGRLAVRTPMQWTRRQERRVLHRAGSRGCPGRSSRAAFGPEFVNVADQRTRPGLAADLHPTLATSATATVPSSAGARARSSTSRTRRCWPTACTWDDGSLVAAAQPRPPSRSTVPLHAGRAASRAPCWSTCWPTARPSPTSKGRVELNLGATATAGCGSPPGLPPPALVLSCLRPRNCRQIAELGRDTCSLSAVSSKTVEQTTCRISPQQLEELKERFGADDFVVEEVDDDDPILRSVDGKIVDTWRESYPYDERMRELRVRGGEASAADRAAQDAELDKATGARQVILFEGRDAAGKGGTIKRFMEHLNPRHARVVALEKPTSREGGSGTSSATSPTCRPRRDRPVRPVLVHPGRGRTGDGVLHRPGVRPVPPSGAAVRGPAGGRGVPADQVLVLGDPGRAEHPVPDPADRPGPASGSCPPPTWPRWTSGMPTPGPRRTCSCTPTPPRRRGR